VAGTGWPLVRQVQLCVPAGSVVLMTQNCFHRRNRRRDSAAAARARPRYMWRFMCYRTTEPARVPARATSDNAGGGGGGGGGGGSAAAPTTAEALIDSFVAAGHDALTGVSLAEEQPHRQQLTTTLWKTALSWVRAERAPPPSVATLAAAAAATASDRGGCGGQGVVGWLAARLHARGDAAEPLRLSAAYELAALCSPASRRRRLLSAPPDPDSGAAVEPQEVCAVLSAAMTHTLEGIRRAATHGMVALGRNCEALAIASLLPLAAEAFPSKWVRKNAAFALGECAPPTPGVLTALRRLLHADDSVHVRATAAFALGGCGRRGGAADGGAADGALAPLLSLLTAEPNRVGQDVTQGLGPYAYRVTDESDLCEGASGAPRMLEHVPSLPGGGGGGGGGPRFQRVRNGVKEAAGWACVQIVTAHMRRADEEGGLLSPATVGAAVDSLSQVIRVDTNVIVVGFAIDAMLRLSRGGGGGGVHGERAAEVARRAIVGGDGWINLESILRAGGVGDGW
jgi:hypothetical protein